MLSYAFWLARGAGLETKLNSLAQYFANKYINKVFTSRWTHLLKSKCWPELQTIKIKQPIASLSKNNWKKKKKQTNTTQRDWSAYKPSEQSDIW